MQTPQMLSKVVLGMILVSMQLSACAQKNPEQSKTFQTMNNTEAKPTEKGLQIATFGAGCFWCTEAQFQQLEGVVKVESGYSGGFVENPTYKAVCTGNTGHAEVTNIHYDPSKISYDELLAAFWIAHDPTQLNRQGNDIGTQYRSVIFYHNEEQKLIAEDYKKKLNEEKAYNSDAVIPTIKLEYRKIGFVFSYDVSLGGNRIYINKSGGFEFTIYLRDFFKNQIKATDATLCPRFEEVNNW